MSPAQFACGIAKNNVATRGGGVLQQALTERQQLQDQNYQLQNKLAEHFRKKKAGLREKGGKAYAAMLSSFVLYM